jgi:hypothetical protein
VLALTDTIELNEVERFLDKLVREVAGDDDDDEAL